MAPHKNKDHNKQGPPTNELEVVYSNITDTLLRLDEDGTISFANKNIENLTQKSPAEVLGMKCWEVFGLNQHECSRCRAKKNKYEQSNLLSYTDPHGMNKTLICRIMPIKDKEGQTSKLIQLITDVSELKGAEEEIAKTNKLLSAIIESPHMLEIYSLDPRFTYTAFNNAHADKMKSEWGVLLRTGMSVWDVVKRDSEAKKLKSNLQIALDGKSLTVLEMKKGENGTRYFENFYSPIKNAEEAVTGIIIYSREVTKQKHTELKLRQAKEKAEESDQLKTAFLANLSHEIRTPMNAILGFAEIISEQDMSPAKMKHFAKIIYNSSSQLLNIVDDIIDISMIESGQVKIHDSKTNLNQLLKETYSFYSNQLSIQNKKHIKLRLKNKLKDKNLIIWADQIRLRQILSNLLNNALKFTKEGEIELACTINRDLMLEFRVNDTGTGIPEEKLSVIFNRFRQADEEMARQYGGTGLGLSISKSLTKLMGGDIWAKNRKQKGASFHFTLPLNIAEDEKPTADTGKAIANKPDWSKKTILLAEDDKLIHEYIENVLEPTNVKLLHAKNGKEAVKACENDDIDLVLMDIQMPEMNGYEAAKQIRKNNKKLPIIAQTAYAMEQDRERSLKAGCNDYLTKPIDQDLLIQKIAFYLGSA